MNTSFKHFFMINISTRVEAPAKGIDFPELNVDLKVTSAKQPQSSCPFRSARQKIYGLGYSLLVFVYEKTDFARRKSGNLRILHTIFVDGNQTADYQTTTGLLRILDNSGNKADLIAFMQDRMLPVDEIAASMLADEIMKNPPLVGYSNNIPMLCNGGYSTAEL